MKVFISQPMSDKTQDQIVEERKRAIENIRSEFPDEEVEIIDSFYEGVADRKNPLFYLGEALKQLASADLAYFIGDWKNYRGCNMEYKACVEYGIKFITENKEE